MLDDVLNETVEAQFTAFDLRRGGRIKSEEFMVDNDTQELVDKSLIRGGISP